MTEKISFWNGRTVHVCCFMLARASTKTFVSRLHIRQPNPKSSEKKKLRQPKNSLAGSLVSRGITVSQILFTCCSTVCDKNLDGLKTVGLLVIVDNSFCYESLFGGQLCVVVSRYGEGVYIEAELLLRSGIVPVTIRRLRSV